MKRKRYTTETIILLFLEIHENLYHYEKVAYKAMHTKVIVICDKHGDFQVSPHMHITRKQGCSKCAFERQQQRQKDTTENFIEKAKKIHKNRYDYSVTNYGNSAHDKVKINCRIHGEFLISPNSHLSKKANCKKCSSITGKRKLSLNNNLGWNKTNWIKRCQDKIAILYIIRCWSETEEFIKIGITSKSLKRRYTTINRMPYQYEVLKVISSDNPSYIFDLENIMLKNSKNLKYKPLIEFNGSTECRTLDFISTIDYAEAH
jgi:hypothetical protein